MSAKFLEQGIPMDDVAAWQSYSEYRWVYDKTRLAEITDTKWALAGVEPEEYPVFLKPISNLFGMGQGTKFITDRKEFLKNYIPGTFWMEVFDGEHLSVDVPVVDGVPKDYLIASGTPGPHRRFNYWKICTTNPDCEYLKQKSVIVDFIENHLVNFTGIVNFEMISTHLIEVHLRGSVQFFPAWENMEDSIKKLYQEKTWKHPSSNCSVYYAVPVWADKYQKFEVDYDALEDIQTRATVMVDYDPEIPSYEYINPPKSFRLATVYGEDLDNTIDRAKIIRSLFS